MVTGGGLSCDERGRLDTTPQWRSCRPGFFLPVRVLSRVFRAKFRDGLRRAFAEGRLTFAGRLAELKEPAAFAAWLTPVCHKDWVVYAKPPFGGPAQILKYLARYTHRVAISNARLLDVSAAGVAFRAKDYADGGKAKTVRLSCEEFLRRFSQHILPRGFVKTRHYGLLANHGRAERLHTCRRLLLPAVLLLAATMGLGPADAIAPATPASCPCCGGVHFARMELPKCSDAPEAAAAPNVAAAGNRSPLHRPPASSAALAERDTS